MHLLYLNLKNLIASKQRKTELRGGTTHQGEAGSVQWLHSWSLRCSLGLLLKHCSSKLENLIVSPSLGHSRNFPVCALPPSRLPSPGDLPVWLLWAPPPHVYLCCFPGLKGHFSTYSNTIPCWGPRSYINISFWRYFHVTLLCTQDLALFRDPNLPKMSWQHHGASLRPRGPKECPPSSGQTAGYLPSIPAVFSPASD